MYDMWLTPVALSKPRLFNHATVPYRPATEISSKVRGEEKGMKDKEMWKSRIIDILTTCRHLEVCPSYANFKPMYTFPGGTMVKNSPANAGDAGDRGSIPRLGGIPGGENGYPLQYSCQENPTDRGAWLATVHRVTKSWTWLKGLRTCTVFSSSRISTFFFITLVYLFCNPYFLQVPILYFLFFQYDSLGLLNSTMCGSFCLWCLLSLYVVVQLQSHVRLCVTPWTAAHQAFLAFTVSQNLLRFISTESVMLSNHLILCHTLLLLPSIFCSIKVFSEESALHIMWPKYWSFRFSISPSNEYSGLISFKIGWFDLPAVQGTLKSFLPHQDQSLIILQSSEACSDQPEHNGPSYFIPRLWGSHGFLVFLFFFFY